MNTEPLTVDDFAPSVDGSALDLMTPPTLDQWTVAIEQLRREDERALDQGIKRILVQRDGDWFEEHAPAPERQPYVYHYERYPHWKYHAVHPERLVHDAAEEAALGPGWCESPADALAPSVDAYIARKRQERSR